MPTERRRVTAIPDGEALAACGYDPAVDPPTECVNAPAAALARLIGRGAKELAGLLDRAEWNATADANNGAFELAYAGPLAPAFYLPANVEDSPELKAKWGVRPGALAAKLRGLSPVQMEAVAAAVRFFWRHCDAIDHTADDWWEPDFRAAVAAGGGDGADDGAA